MTSPVSGYTYPYAMTSVATDIVVFHVTERSGIAERSGLQIALVRRNADSTAFAHCWALPGGFFRPEHDLDISACALRELSEEAGLQFQRSLTVPSHMELVGVYSAKDRDPRPERVISIAYLAVLAGEQALLSPIPDTDVSEARWFPIEAVAELDLAFDHDEIIRDARKKLADRMSFARKDDQSPDLLFAFLPDKFTLTNAQRVMEALKGERVDKSNFRKYIDRFVVATGDTLPMKTRPAAVYRRRSLDPAEDVSLLSPGLARVRKLAEDQQIVNFELFLAGMSMAPDEAVRMLGRIVSTYGRHRDYLLKTTRVPDLRIDDGRTERVLMTLKWQPQKNAFFCTSLARPTEINASGVSDLKEWTSGPHKSAFRLGCTEDDLDRLAEVLDKAAAVLSIR